MNKFNNAPATERTIDTPVLVERTQQSPDDPGRIEVWDSTGERHRLINRLGKEVMTILVRSQERNEGGEHSYKFVPEKKLQEDHQSELAEQLASDPMLSKNKEQRYASSESEASKERTISPSKHHERILSSPQLRELFEAKKRPERGDIDYDKVFSGEAISVDENDNYVTSDEELQLEEAQRAYDRYHTPDAREYSIAIVSNLKNVDHALASLLEGLAGGRASDAVEHLGSNTESRLLVAALLREKLDFLAENDPSMPPRVVNNSNGNRKRPNAAGYGKNTYSSRDYVVKLALDKLSGGFEPNESNKDEIREDPHTGVVTLGQHRAAADRLVREL
jgi:hypothetical protein